MDEFPLSPDDPLDVSGNGVTVEFSIIPYDYDDESEDMALYDLVVEGRTVISLNRDDYGDAWRLRERDGTWYYQSLLGGEVHSDYRFDVAEVVDERLRYWNREYLRYAEAAEGYAGLSVWDLYDLTEEIRGLESNLQDVGHDIQRFTPNAVRDQRVESLYDAAAEVRADAHEALALADDLEEVAQRLADEQLEDD